MLTRGWWRRRGGAGDEAEAAAVPTSTSGFAAGPPYARGGVGRETARRRPSARGRVAWLAPDAREGRVTRGSSEGRCVVDARGVLVKLLQICLVRPMH